MKQLLTIILIFAVAACKAQGQSGKAVSQGKVTDNVELTEIYRNDQADRQTDAIDWSIISERDSLREKRAYELLDSNKVHTSKDYHNAAMIFQHGRDSTAYGR